MNKNLIAKELKNVGFETKITTNGVIVSLNRPMFQSEVRDAFIQVFGFCPILKRVYSNEILIKDK